VKVSLSAPALVAAESPRLLTVQQAAAYLSVTVWYVRDQFIRGKRVPHVKLGRRHLFDRKDLDAFVESVKKEAA